MATARPAVLKTYQGITDVPLVAQSHDEVTKARAMGDLTEETNLAAEILRKWLAVARHNIGAATTTRLLHAAIDECER